MTDPVQQDFHAAIARHFAYLFDEYGFEFVGEMNERQGEYQMQIAASPQCQIKFTLEQDAFAVYFGRSDAPRIFQEEQDGVTWWHSMPVLMVFEDSIHPSEAARLPPGQPDAPLDRVLQAYATLLRAYLPRLIQAFWPHPPPDWWPRYEAFRLR